jgi:oxepin-CoA hydrolase/3-oxo-5,6-dehydrosuberyl-CoA semialdehyde dehydrogenase
MHGGPGRAGGGEEMGGLNGLHFFLQKTAIQGSPDVLKQLLKFISRELRKNSQINILSRNILKKLK